MVYRPTSVTVIAWLTIILGVSSLLVSLQMILRPHPDAQKIVAEGPLPTYVQHGMMIGGTVIHLVCGFFMLRGRNWARTLFVAWSIIGLCIGLATSPYKFAMLPGVVMFAIEVFFLFRPPANMFFANNGANIDPASLPSNRRVAGVVFYILAGFVLTCMGMATLMAGPALTGKTLMLCFFLLPFSVCLAIGKWLAAGNWRLDVGYVFVLGSLGGASMATMMASKFSRPEFLQRLPPKQVEHMQEMFTDYTFAGLWFGAWLLLGVALISLGRRKPVAPQFPPIFGR